MGEYHSPPPNTHAQLALHCESGPLAESSPSLPPRLCRVNVYKDKIKNAGSLPQLPQQASLADALAGSYAELR